jgi:hypothetical protein
MGRGSRQQSAAYIYLNDAVMEGQTGYLHIGVGVILRLINFGNSGAGCAILLYQFQSGVNRTQSIRCKANPFFHKQPPHALPMVSDLDPDSLSIRKNKAEINGNKKVRIAQCQKE